MVHQSTLPSLENNFLILAQNDPHYAYLPMDGWTDLLTDQWMDTPAYRVVAQD